MKIRAICSAGLHVGSAHTAHTYTYITSIKISSFANYGLNCLYAVVVQVAFIEDCNWQNQK